MATILKFIGGIIARVLSAMLGTPAKEVQVENTGTKDLEATSDSDLCKQYWHWMYHRSQGEGKDRV